MRKPLVAANWKMHGSRELVTTFFTTLRQRAAGVEVAVFPPFVYLAQAVECAAGGPGVGGQNLSAEAPGAFTGEVSADMLVDVGCRYVLVGHSERRTLYGETDRVVADKFAVALAAGLVPVLCIGESLVERQAETTLDVVRRQLDAVFAAGDFDVSTAVIAYEPVWAIGTGQTATPEQAQEVHSAIRGHLGASGEIARILYGGSVKAANADELFSQPDIDGGLVGGASLDADEFIAICASAKTK